MNKKIVIGIGVVVIILMGAYVVMQSGNNQNSGQTTTQTTLGVKEITIIGTDFAFSPSSITVKAGEKVKLNFNNDGSYPHNWVIEGQGITTKTVPGSGGDAIEFTAPAKGQYTVFCSVPGHRERGMVGTLNVE